jgi:hypothetical protein
MARFKASKADLTVICTYIPHQGRPGGQKPIYEELNEVIATVSTHDCLVILGDLKAVLADLITLTISKTKNMLVDGRSIIGTVQVESCYVNSYFDTIYAQSQLYSNLARNETMLLG